jgi:hypothetical protein
MTPLCRHPVCLLALGAILGLGTSAWGQDNKDKQDSQSNDRVVTAEAPIVAGNAVLAKQRALGDAFRQAAERGFAVVLAESGDAAASLPPALAQLRASFATRGQRFVRSYRVLEQDESAGKLRLQIEAEVDMALLRREIDRVRGANATGANVVPVVAEMPPFLVAGAVPSEVRLIAVNAFVAAGVRAQASPIADEASLTTAAAGQGSQAVLLAATATPEGAIRGANRVSVRCELRARVTAAPTMGPGSKLDRKEEDRGFAVDENAARMACWERGAQGLTRSVVAAFRPAPASTRYVELTLDLADPSALTAVIQGIKRLGAVSTTEVRHVTARAAEVRLFTRMGGPTIASALIRELAGRLALSNTKPATVDHVWLQARTPEVGDVANPEPSP